VVPGETVMSIRILSLAGVMALGAGLAIAPAAHAQTIGELPIPGVLLFQPSFPPGSFTTLSNSYFPNTSLSAQRFRNLKVAGRIPVDEAKLPKDAKVVRLRVNGNTIAMRLDTEVASADLKFGPGQEYAKELYRSVLTKRIEVIGDAALRDQIVQAAAQSKIVEIEGYVFDRTSPYLVVRTVSEKD
jgi:hypothetical protein